MTSHQEEFDEELYEGEEPVTLDESFGCVVIVDNLPKVPKAKFSKLEVVIRKIYSAYGEIKDIYLPMPEGKTLGYAFIEYRTEDEASVASVKGDNRKLDAKHTLRCNLLSSLKDLEELPEEHEDPPKGEFETKTNPTSWLLDEFGRDQFVVRFGADTHVYWNDPLRKANNQGRVLQYGGEREIANHKRWTESYVGWSPQGSHLATFHAQGIMLWGGEDFEQTGKFAHNAVMEMDFSPQEGYLVTTNFIERSDVDPTPSIQIWDILTGKMMRGFDNPKKTWPSFLWSSDDKYFMRMGMVSKGGVDTECVSIYETPSMGLLDKASLPLPGLAAVAWSPSDNVFAYYVPEKGNLPCRIGLVAIPSREVIRE
jgi:translation initiation factor 3 subunit B